MDGEERANDPAVVRAEGQDARRSASPTRNKRRRPADARRHASDEPWTARSEPMTGPSFDLPSVDRLTVGTVGPVGQRTFYIQARQADQLVTLKVEKQQVSALAQFLGGLLADLPAVGALPDDMELEEPAEEEWAVGTLQIS